MSRIHFEKKSQIEPFESSVTIYIAMISFPRDVSAENCEVKNMQIYRAVFSRAWLNFHQAFTHQLTKYLQSGEVCEIIC